MLRNTVSDDTEFEMDTIPSLFIMIDKIEFASLINQKISGSQQIVKDDL